MHIHILGICGTFMGGLALLARELGIEVSGCDANVYPPMSDQLAAAGIALTEGYQAETLPEADLYVLGNAMSRGNPAVEYLLNRGLPYTSGPQWLAQQVLQDRWVLAVSGTHGKTTTSSMLAWILEYAGLQPGFLIGGVPDNFNISARLGRSPFFVIEADEYDTAFFDKRSKFVHYRPRTLLINNLEFDHADIFADLAAIQRQFHHLIRTVPGEGLIIRPADDVAVTETLAIGCWTAQQDFGMTAADWQAELQIADGSRFIVRHGDQQAEVHWSLLGNHNVNNGLAALAASHHVGVTLQHGAEALSAFAGVKRRLELRGEVAGIQVYDDFAHHPTAIASTIAGLRAKAADNRLVAILEPRSNTMKMGVHQHTLAAALAAADAVLLYQDDSLDWSLQTVCDQLDGKARVFDSVEAIVAQLSQQALPGDQLLIMSNGGFAGIHQKLLTALEQKYS